MKKLTLILTGFLMVAGLYGLAVSSASADENHENDSSPGQATEFWAHMAEMRNIMHFALVNSEPLEDGVRVTVTSNQGELAAAIKEEFGSERHELKAPYPNTEVAAQPLENGVALTFVSSDPGTVQALQAQSGNLFYGMLRDNMHSLMAGQGGFRGGSYGGMRGQGMMGPGGYGSGWGGHGMMGPGMMGRGGHGPGMMGPGAYGPGNGHGMMGPGGYGPGSGATGGESGL